MVVGWIWRQDRAAAGWTARQLEVGRISGQDWVPVCRIHYHHIRAAVGYGGGWYDRESVGTISWQDRAVVGKISQHDRTAFGVVGPPCRQLMKTLLGTRAG